MIANSDPTFVLPMPCQGTGASPFNAVSPFFKMPSTACNSAEPQHNNPAARDGKNIFSWRPDLENVLIDALELSIEDVISRQQKQQLPT